MENNYNIDIDNIDYYIDALGLSDPPEFKIPEDKSFIGNLLKKIKESKKMSEEEKIETNFENEEEKIEFVDMNGEVVATAEKSNDGIMPVEEEKTEENIENVAKYLLSDKQYNILKWIGLLLLPTIAWLYQSIAYVWGLPFSDQISWTINIIGTFIAIVIGASQLKASK